jgi:predicted AAA+ superfamily ATPase
MRRNAFPFLLESLFLIWFPPAWSNNLNKRLVKSPKIHVCGSGLACHRRGALGDNFIRGKQTRCKPAMPKGRYL